MQALTGSSASKGFAAVFGVIATALAGAVGLVFALLFAAAVVVVGIVGTVLITLTGLAMKARRSARPVASNSAGDVIEARRVGGHSWVAYGWDNRR